MNKAYYKLLATNPQAVFLSYLMLVGGMTFASCMIAPYSNSLKSLAYLSVGFFMLGVVGLVRDYYKSKRMTF